MDALAQLDDTEDRAWRAIAWWKGSPFTRSMAEQTCRAGTYLVLECFRCGELAEAEGLGAKALPRCSCGYPYSVEVATRRGRPSLSTGLRAALYLALVGPLSSPVPGDRAGGRGSVGVGARGRPRASYGALPVAIDGGV